MKAAAFAKAAAVLAEEASTLALERQGIGHDSEVALRAARHAREAAQALDALAEREATIEEAVRLATWALSAASVALAQAKLPPAPKTHGRAGLAGLS